MPTATMHNNTVQHKKNPVQSLSQRSRVDASTDALVPHGTRPYPRVPILLFNRLYLTAF